MVKATSANLLWWLASSRLYATFTSALSDPDAAQAQVLRAFLRQNANTAFGREHGFSEMRTPEEFARRVPIRNYDELWPWIDRIRRGQHQVLTKEPVRRLVPTSGSTAARKLVPYTASMYRQLNRAVGPWIFDLYRKHPGALTGVSYWSISPISQDAFSVADGSSVPVGFDEDAAYLGVLRRLAVNATMAVPPDLRYIASMEDWRYVTALLLLQRSDLTLISVWHPSFLSLLLQAMRDNWDQLLSNMSTGTCAMMRRLPRSVAAYIRSHADAPRAQELRGNFPNALGELWPKLAVVSCWTDGHAAGAAAELAPSLGSVSVQAKGLVATEGIISIPFKGLHPLAIRSHYLEFEDDSGHVLPSSDLRESHEYNVILTTAGGLCRYRLNDRVVVNGRLGRTPSVRFVGKSALVSDRMGEKLSDAFVASVFSNLFRDVRIRPSFVILAPDVDGSGCRYTLYMSSDASNDICTKLDVLLSENPHYAYCRRLTQLRPPRLFRVSGNAHAAYFERLQRMGKRLGDIKPVGLSSLDGWSKHLSGHYIE